MVEQLIKNLHLHKITQSPVQVQAIFRKEQPRIEISLTWHFRHNDGMIDACYNFFNENRDDEWRLSELFYFENGAPFEWRISRSSGHYWKWNPSVSVILQKDLLLKD